MKIDIANPRKLAEWLQITINQRERQHKLMAQQFGQDSAAANAIALEIADVRAVAASCLQALADAPKKT